MKQFILSFLLYIMAIGVMEGQEQFTVYFNFDIDEASDASGKKLSQWIANHKDTPVLRVYGFADATGNPAYNIDLSERRAAYVMQQLREAGIQTGGAEVKGLGETQASGSNSKDRKAVVYFKNRTQPPVAVKPQPESSAFKKTVTTAAKGEKIRIPNLNFYDNSDIILPESRPVMIELFQILKSNPALKIDIQGHICCQKIEENEISLKRAVAVYKLLIKNGIDKSRLSYKSFGSSKPIHALPEKNEGEKAANRRVEIEILDN